jgi:predicted transcriptional regulator of viral defense system
VIQVKSLEVLELLESAASDQWGIITTAQAQREGVSRLQISRLAERGVLTRTRRGVYLLPSAQYGPLTDIRAAWVFLGSDRFPDERLNSADDVYVSHESAALIHQIGDLIPGKSFFSTASRKQTGQKDIHIYSHRSVESGDIDNIEGLPVASVERTVADLASAKIEFNYLATLVTDALRKEGIRLKNLAHRLDQSAPSYGFQSGRQLLHACQDEAESDEDSEERYERVAGKIIANMGPVPLPPTLPISAFTTLHEQTRIINNQFSKALADFIGNGGLNRLAREQAGLTTLGKQMTNLTQGYLRSAGLSAQIAGIIQNQAEGLFPALPNFAPGLANNLPIEGQGESLQSEKKESADTFKDADQEERSK